MLREGALHLVERAWFGEPLHGYDVRAVGLRVEGGKDLIEEAARLGGGPGVGALERRRRE